ncbi:MAG: colanic acid biosynthesis glycosyltransferase WcaI [Zetaproteobacteria bacterium CG12_big_fil_rev_8_21_14_0_65_55_1124]|nr:MAG: glycosyl transferase [Zetaproteobacteria bacterium CG1_02_55_237]PIS19748.1 MAG: colanic acid biosynthesis glycosyltransferase WcaI [Zetaproteobacteria bacterium CG08_land_8_20_14_0_20_55_17]PIW43513.1 MAG: colanic acid biosynthesis glycosyltransferase WcaI [Zetaproteobacteria bacterium CG12_big_fil_rev_8_21_14_0_65_55_1124]PIY54144.1 MAG: colanic acid biosynthesis glycosyltransferase WcaI [Zetaproteobacteria bacterium CG_4_10_14_0_8_um_filter_55_43]PIZ39139.1 MAG: colanic acid biosynth
MRILIHGINYAPELTGIGKYTGEMAAWLVAQGHKVCVVTAPPYYPEWKVALGYSTSYYKHEDIDGLYVWRCPLYVPAKPSGLNRIMHLASFSLSSLPIMIRQILWKPDVVIVVEPPLFCAPSAWLVARLSRAKCWLHIQDFEVDAAFDLGIIPYAWMKHMASAIERWVMRRFDAVSTISHSMLNSLRKKGVDEPILFPNWSDISSMRFDGSGRTLFRAKLGVGEGQCLCLYSGNIAVKQGLEILLEVAEKLPDFRFVICGDGVNRKALQDEVDRLELANIAFLPLQPLERLPAMLSAADIHLVIQRRGAADLVMPSKLANILAIGGPAIVTVEEDSELGRLAEGDNPCVFRCDPENAEKLETAIVQLYGNKDMVEKISINARVYAEQQIDMERVLGKFEQSLRDLVEH